MDTDRAAASSSRGPAAAPAEAGAAGLAAPAPRRSRIHGPELAPGTAFAVPDSLAALTSTAAAAVDAAGVGAVLGGMRASGFGGPVPGGGGSGGNGAGGSRGLGPRVSSRPALHIREQDIIAMAQMDCTDASAVGLGSLLMPGAVGSNGRRQAAGNQQPGQEAPGNGIDVFAY
jgi:hypothetical protein